MKWIKRMTNKKIIAELFPILKKACSVKPELNDKNFYGKPCKEIYIDGRRVIYTEIAKNIISIEVIMPLTGKYDHATVSAIINNGKISYGYAKEYRGLGNGFYAQLDEKGNLTKSEWD